MKTLVIAIVLSAAAGAVHAQERPVSVPPPGQEAGVPSVTRQAMAPNELADLNGRQGSTSTVLSDQDLTAVNRGNTITATTVGSGPITLGPGAFDGFAGVGNFVINSGHNNNLQGALTINVIAPQ